MIKFDEGMHAYFDEKGFILPSVTQILGSVYGTGLENAPSYFVERSAQKGTKIHKEIEEYLKTGKNGETPEFEVWHKWFTTGSPITDYKSEQIIYAETPHGAFAGTADFFANGFLYDWKTCKTATRQQIDKWQKQMSFYIYALRQMGQTVNEPAKILHLTDHYEVINVDYLGDKFVEDTMKLYAEGQKPQETAILPKETALQTLTPTELQTFQDVLIQIDALKKVEAEFRERIKAEMEQRSILSVKIGNVNLTYVAGSKRSSFDSDAFKKEHNDLYLQYQTEKEVKPSLRITVK